MSQKIKALVAIAGFWSAIALTLPAKAEIVSQPCSNEGASCQAQARPKPTTPQQASGTIADIAATNSSFDILTLALAAAGLTQTLSGQGPFTVFAPTDQAFSALPKETLLKLLQPESKEQLAKILTYHVVSGKITSKDIRSSAVKTVQGGNLQVAVQQNPAGVKVNEAKVVQADVMATNGVIHVIDKVLLPPDSAKSPGQ